MTPQEKQTLGTIRSNLFNEEARQKEHDSRLELEELMTLTNSDKGRSDIRIHKTI